MRAKNRAFIPTPELKSALEQVVKKLAFERKMHNADMPPSMQIDPSYQAISAQLKGEITYEINQNGLSPLAAIQNVLAYHTQRPLGIKTPDQARAHIELVKRTHPHTPAHVSAGQLSYTLYRSTNLVNKYV